MPPMEATLMADRWLGRHEAAAYLGISTRAFDRLVADPEVKIHKYQATNRRVIFDREEIDAHIRSTRKP